MANITTRRKSGLVLRSGSMRRKTVWLSIGPTDNALTAASQAVLFTGLNAAALALRPFTVVRTRGLFHVISDQVAASETFGAVLAMAVVTDQALAIGVTAVPTGATDRASDEFYVYEEIIGRYIFGTAVGSETVAETASVRFDSKAMRKVDVGQDIAFTIETQSIVTGAQVKKMGRFLVKLH